MNRIVSKAFRFVAPLTLIGSTFWGISLPANAAEIDHVSLETFQCIKENGSSDRGYLSFPNGNSGTVDAYANALDVWGGSVDFTYNPNAQTLIVTNPQGPGGDRIVEGLRDIAQQCMNGELN